MPSSRERGAADHGSRTLVLLSLGYKAVEHATTAATDEPQPHWREVARLTGATIESWATARARRGRVFARSFGARPLWGVAASAALDADRYDRIYALDEDCGFRAALLLRARGWKGRLVCLVHRLSPPRRRVVELLRDRPFGHFFVYTDVQEAALLAAGIAPDRVTCAPIPADTTFFAPAPPHSGRGRIVSIGAADRDYETLFRAASSIDADIEIFGHGYTGADAAGLVPGALPANVKLMPRVPVNVLRDHLAGATALVLPLRPVDYAAGATVLTEAMASGVPVVATRMDGIARYLDAARPGPEYGPGDADTLARAVSSLLDNRAAAASIGAANRMWALAHARVEVFADDVVAALAGNPVSPRPWRSGEAGDD